MELYFYLLSAGCLWDMHLVNAVRALQWWVRACSRGLCFVGCLEGSIIVWSMLSFSFVGFCIRASSVGGMGYVELSFN